jgi:hypothetical protein
LTTAARQQQQQSMMTLLLLLLLKHTMAWYQQLLEIRSLLRVWLAVLRMVLLSMAGMVLAATRQQQQHVVQQQQQGQQQQGQQQQQPPQAGYQLCTYTPSSHVPHSLLLPGPWDPTACYMTESGR